MLAEQGRPSPDIALLQERGGLTPVHWEEVVRRTPKPSMQIAPDKYPLWAKIVAYGQKVIDGEFPDTNNHHRMYLGQRHWRLILQLNPRDEVKKSRIFPPWSKTELVTSKFAELVRQYAAFEYSATYTLNDHIASIGSKGDHETWYRYDLPEGYWVRVREVVREPTPGGWLPATSHDWSRYDGGTDIVTIRADEIEILNLWLSTKEESQDPLHTSPTILTDRLRELAVLKPDEIRERLRVRTPHLSHLHDSPHLGILEREVA